MEAEKWPRGGFPGIGNAAGEEFLAAWAVMDPVHVVALAAGKVDERHTPVESPGASTSAARSRSLRHR